MSAAEQITSRRTGFRNNQSDTTSQTQTDSANIDDDKPSPNPKRQTHSNHAGNEISAENSDEDTTSKSMQTRSKQRVIYEEQGDYTEEPEYYYSEVDINEEEEEEEEEEEAPVETKRIRRPVQRYGASDLVQPKRPQSRSISPPPKKKRAPPKPKVQVFSDYSDGDYSDSDIEQNWIVERIIGQKDQSKVQVESDKSTEDDDDTTTDQEEQLYFVKFKEKAYIHAKWLTEVDIMKYENGENALKRFKNRSDREGLIMSHSLSDLLSLESQTFDSSYQEVDRIINDAEGRHGHEYLVKWNGLQYDECTWENESDVDPAKIAEYENRLKHSNPISIPARWKRPPASDYENIEEDVTANNGMSLRSYQLEGLNWLRFCWFNQRNSILADEMGLGKTAQLVSMVEYLRSTYDISGPFLVIAPLSTLGHWKKEFENWSKLNVVVYHGNQSARDLIKECEFQVTDTRGRVLPDRVQFDVIVTNYESVNIDFKIFQEIEWRYLVLDEGHKLKNHKGQLYNKLVTLRYEHCTLLTGTPIQNNMEELWSLLHFIDPMNFNDLDQFMQKYGLMTDSTQVTEIQEMIGPYILRRKKGDVEKSIIPKEETIIEVELTRIQKTFYRALLQDNASVLLQQITNGAIVSLQNLMMQLRKVCNHPFLIKGAEESIVKDFTRNSSSSDDQSHADSETRLHALIESSGKMILIDKLLPKLRADNHKVLIFSQMVRVLDIIEDFLRLRGYEYERLDGGSRAIDRTAAIERFATDPERFVFLLSTKAGGVGINLTAADTVIIYDSDWNPQNDIQAEARCHRIGQKAKVKVYRLITNNTYENQMFERASKKLGLDHVVLDGGEVGGDQPMKAKEVEKLLRDGAFAIFEGDDTEADTFCTQDIDQILESRARVFKEDIVAGDGSTFSKAQFKPTNPNDELDNNEFWSNLFVSANIDPTSHIRRCRQDRFEQDAQGPTTQQRDQCTKLIELGFTNQPPEHSMLRVAYSIQGGLEPFSDQIVKNIIQTGLTGNQPIISSDPLSEYGEVTYIIEDRCEKILGRVAYFARLRRALYFVQPDDAQWPTVTPAWETPIIEYGVMVGLHRYGFHFKVMQNDESLQIEEVKILSRRAVEKRMFKIVEAIEKQFPDRMDEYAPFDFEPLPPAEWMKNHPDLLSRSTVVDHEAQQIFNTISAIGKPLNDRGEIDWNRIREFSNLLYVTNEAVQKIGQQIYALVDRDIGTTLDLTDFPDLEPLKLTVPQIRKVQQIVDDLAHLSFFLRTFDDTSATLLKEATNKQSHAFPDWWDDRCDFALIQSLAVYGIYFVSRWIVDPKLPFRQHIPPALLEGFEKAAEAETTKNKFVRPVDVGEFQFIFRERTRLARATLIASSVLRHHKLLRTKKTRKSRKGRTSTLRVINIGTLKKGKAFIGDGYVFPVGYEVLRYLKSAPEKGAEGAWFSCRITEFDKAPYFICEECTSENEIIPNGARAEGPSLSVVTKGAVHLKWPDKPVKFPSGCSRAFGLTSESVKSMIGNNLFDAFKQKPKALESDANTENEAKRKKKNKRPDLPIEVQRNLLDFVIILPVLNIQVETNSTKAVPYVEKPPG